ncbi:MAG: RNA polymerase sigma factor [Solirubrobacteraceae bacterium]|nr:RNA polymerase sigma factor [Patulibacter sp.]
MPAHQLDITALYERHRDDLLVFLARRTADPEVALDLWSETFAQAILSKRRYRGRTDAEADAWLYGIAKHQLLHWYRRGSAERRAMERLGIERPVLTPEVEESVVRRAGLDAIRGDLADAIGALSHDVREAITLRVVDELPYADVARRLSISEQAARTRVSRGLKALADTLDPRSLEEALQS